MTNNKLQEIADRCGLTLFGSAGALSTYRQLASEFITEAYALGRSESDNASLENLLKTVKQKRIEIYANQSSGGYEQGKHSGYMHVEEIIDQQINSITNKS